MTTATARKLLNIVSTLEGMVQEIQSKRILLKSKLSTSKSESETKNLKDYSVILGSEIDNINVTIDLVEDLSEHLATV